MWLKVRFCLLCLGWEKRWDLVTVSRTNFCFEMNLGKVPHQSLIKQPEEYKKTLDQAGKYTSHSTQCRESKHQVQEVYIFFYIFTFSCAVKRQFPCFILLYKGSPVSLLWRPLDLDTDCQCSVLCNLHCQCNPAAQSIHWEDQWTETRATVGNVNIDQVAQGPGSQVGWCQNVNTVLRCQYCDVLQNYSLI